MVSSRRQLAQRRRPDSPVLPGSSPNAGDLAALPSASSRPPSILLLLLQGRPTTALSRSPAARRGHLLAGDAAPRGEDPLVSGG
jgi:hypothetical protein